MASTPNKICSALPETIATAMVPMATAALRLPVRMNILVVSCNCQFLLCVLVCYVMFVIWQYQFYIVGLTNRLDVIVDQGRSTCDV